MHSVEFASHSLATGDVIYQEVKGMGEGKRRPCVVIAGTQNQVFLIPLSTQNWNPTINPVIHFRGGISFVVLDRIFTMNIQDCCVANNRVSEGAISTCLKALTSAVISGCWQ